LEELFLVKYKNLFFFKTEIFAFIDGKHQESKDKNPILEVIFENPKQ